ncbi:MAG: tetratricopeptide repeat protein [Synechococcaceae cyanobacterium]|nr:tetratricopeptide repeat protein [Synechococcaceae cyanobacterium]
MPTPPRLTPGRRSLLLTIAIALAALGGGWWLGQLQHRSRAAASDPRRAVLSREVAGLRRNLERDTATASDRQRLLELLVALDRQSEAIALLEPMADREPDRWSLRLMLAELRRDGGDRSGAERELRQILSRLPNQVEALELMSLIRLEQGRGSVAEAQVRQAYQSASLPLMRPEALGLGLLLADLQQKRGNGGQAEVTYLRLARDFPADQRPLLALALLLRERGNSRGAQEALIQARLRSPDPGKPDPRLDDLAASWGLASLRGPSAPAQARPTPAPTSPQNP